MSAARRRVISTSLAALVVLVVPVGCSGELPERVQASIEPTGSGGPEAAVIHLVADEIGGGCNAGRMFSIEVDSRISGTIQIVSIGAHDYRSDGGECTDLASAEAEIPLDEGFFDGDLDTLRFDLDGRENSFRVDVVDGQLAVDEITASNVDLRVNR